MPILNFGSINIDYVYHMDTFVQPGETKMSKSRSVFAGGKGFNQSIALGRAGAEVYHAGCLCKDDTFLTRLLAEAGVRTDYLRQIDHPTGHTIIQIDDSGQNCIILDSGANACMTEAYIDEVLGHFGEGDLLLLQNEINLIPRLISGARQRGMTVAFNPSPINRELLSYPLELVDIFLLNEIEGRELAGCGDIEQIPDRMLDRFPHARVVLTLGKLGCVYAGQNRRERHGIFDCEAVDTTAAGDTFTGYFLDSICRGMDVRDALKRASAAASISVSRDGASSSIPCAEEVEQMLKRM